MKHALAGFIAGALLAGLALKLMTRERAAKPEAVPASDPVAEAAAGGVTPAGTGGRELSDATARLEKLRTELAALQSAANAVPRGGSGSAARRADMAKLFLSRLDEYTENEDLKVPANEEMMLQLQALMRCLAEELSIGLDEVGASPEGFAALARAVLDGLEPKLTAEQRAAADAVFEAARKEWEDLAKSRGGMTRLERGGLASAIQERLTSGLWDCLEDRAGDAISGLDTLWSYAQPTWSGYQSTTWVASPEDAASKWTDRWTNDLGLTAAQKIALRPIVDDYVRGLQDLGPGDTPGAERRSKGAFRLMVRAQHRMLDTLGLTPEQLENLDAQVTVYDFEIRKPR